ncbi:MAG: hypothetical protein Q9212_003956 [Teloschistes hypoglaucus]
MPSRGGARGKSGGGKRPPPPREEMVSKAMSYVLRHGAEKEGLKLDEGGYVDCGELIELIYFYCALLLVSIMGETSEQEQMYFPLPLRTV